MKPSMKLSDYLDMQNKEFREFDGLDQKDKEAVGIRYYLETDMHIYSDSKITSDFSRWYKEHYTDYKARGLFNNLEKALVYGTRKPDSELKENRLYLD